MMCRVLDWLYAISGAMAAFFLAAIAVIVLLQVGANLLDFLARMIGLPPFGILIPSYADLAGFFLAATTFLALAHTLRRGDHIRVRVVLERLPPKAQHAAEIWSLAAGAALAGYFSFYAAALVAESWRFGDVSPGLIAVPLWLPQGAMAMGAIILTIALLDDLYQVLRGRPASFADQPAAIQSD